ncbi:hypothetical protein CCUG60884_00203 [Mycobacteroides salmoniphilum]|uniref:Uncharacterized protein n=1 Tax=Mycobacteroides salmoniphilum TaxID=404941 RepID=A0A4R8T036_9MYCO|nr:hypothetical protein CCUG60884_00203 [Mycobacteroides salmoniphilum]
MLALKGPPCSVCRKPMLCGQKGMHLSCSPTCPKCYTPIQYGHTCPTKDNKKGEV